MKQESDLNHKSETLQVNSLIIYVEINSLVGATGYASIRVITVKSGLLYSDFETSTLK